MVHSRKDDGPCGEAHLCSQKPGGSLAHSEDTKAPFYSLSALLVEYVLYRAARECMHACMQSLKAVIADQGTIDPDSTMLGTTHALPIFNCAKR